MGKFILTIYIISLLGSGNGIQKDVQTSSFDSLQACENQIKLMKISTIGKDVSSTVVANCAGADVKYRDG